MIEEKLDIVQIVRNWGPVGGMEAYVWHISQELAQQNYSVTVICEKSHTQSIKNIRVIELGQLRQKPRWLLYWRFANKVDAIVQTLRAHKKIIVHSHERSISHDITTFHSMPFATIKDKAWWKKISIRVWIYLKLETRELGDFPNSSVKIIPVSKVISKAIEKYYPSIKNKIEAPITPGITSMPTRKYHAIPKDGGTIGFIGKEWRRKGFELFMEIAEELKAQRPHLKIIVLGPDKEQVSQLLKNYSGEVDFKGWQPSSNFYQDIDLLIHPASSEAYGMVISEAMSCKVPVLVSDACGAAADVSTEHGSVLSLNEPLNRWVEESNYWLNYPDELKEYKRTWAQVAKEYIEQYKLIHQAIEK